MVRQENIRTLKKASLNIPEKKSNCPVKFTTKMIFLCIVVAHIVHNGFLSQLSYYSLHTEQERVGKLFSKKLKVIRKDFKCL